MKNLEKGKKEKTVIAPMEGKRGDFLPSLDEPLPGG